MNAFAGRTALVTGAAAGIGQAIAEALADGGARVVALDRDAAGTERCVTRLRALGADVLPAVVDLADPDAIDTALQGIDVAAAAIDMLVLCASVEIREPWQAVSNAAMNLQWAVNLSATVQLVRALVPGMRERGFGRVVAVGSVQESRPREDCLVYAASKAAQTQMMLNWARHAAASGVTFNVLRPGAIETERNRALLANTAYRDAVVARVPLGRIGLPADCVGAAMLLCSPAATYLNGAVIDVDGGMRL
jgi:NAD(P)-dependent dehydrogenase (short-subunit alcohol dehydrogenase family)